MRNSANQGNQGKLYSGEIWLIRKLMIIKTKRAQLKYTFTETYVAKMFKVNQSTIHEIWNYTHYLCKEGYYC